MGIVSFSEEQHWSIRTILVAASLVLALAATADCSAEDLLTGQVLAGGTPIVGAVVTLYGSVSECVPDPCFVTTKPAEEATSDIRGNFALDISKARATTMTMGIPPEPRFKRVQVPPANGTLFLIASGGNAGQGINPAIKLATFLGSAPAGRHVVINELTTALAFLCSGRISAFPGGMSPFALDLFIRLIDPSNARLRPFPGTPSNSPSLVNTVADALNACVASEGENSKECTALLQATSPVRFNNRATDTLSAAESIVFHPDRNSGKVFEISKLSSAYKPALTEPPAGWMLSLNFKGGGLHRPTAITAERRPDRLWIINSSSNALTVLSSDPFQLGNSLAGSGLQIKGLRQPSALWFQEGVSMPPSDSGPIGPNTNQWWATHNRIWVTDKSANELTAITPEDGGRFSTSQFRGNGLAAPSGIIGYPNNVIYDHIGGRDILYALIMVTNSGADRVSFFRLDGTACGPPLENIGLKNPVGLEVYGAVVLIANSGADNLLVIKPPDVTCRGATLVGRISGGGMDVPRYVAGGFVTNRGNGSVTGLDWNAEEPARILLGSPFRGGGLAEPEGIARDSEGVLWVANHAPGANSVSLLAGPLGLADLGKIQVGQPLSPNSGFAGAGLDRPYGVAIDKWGNLWVTNEGNDSVTVLVGAAQPPIQ